MEVLRGIANVLSSILPTFSGDDTDIMSSETRRILSNRVDRENYIKAVRELRRHPETPQKITLSTKEEIIISR